MERQPAVAAFPGGQGRPPLQIAVMGKIVSKEEAAIICERLRAKGKAIVFTNGHFDLLHVGNLDCLERAKALGDVLVVGLNSDASTRLLKGDKHPIMPQEERARLVAALECVDYVVIFEERTAENLLKALKPDIYAKGGDYGEGKELPEAKVVAEYGGRVEILPYLPNCSTSRLIETILERYGL